MIKLAIIQSGSSGWFFIGIDLVFVQKKCPEISTIKFNFQSRITNQIKNKYFNILVYSAKFKQFHSAICLELCLFSLECLMFKLILIHIGLMLNYAIFIPFIFFMTSHYSCILICRSCTELYIFARNLFFFVLFYRIIWQQTRPGLARPGRKQFNSPHRLDWIWSKILKKNSVFFFGLGKKNSRLRRKFHFWIVEPVRFFIIGWFISENLYLSWSILLVLFRSNFLLLLIWPIFNPKISQTKTESTDHSTCHYFSS